MIVFFRTYGQGPIVWKGSRGNQARQWLGDVNEWAGLCLNEMWKEPEDRVVGIKCVTLVVPSGLNSQWHSRF